MLFRDFTFEMSHDFKADISVREEQFLNRYSKEGETVVDLFGGSGCTLIACEKNNRRARLMEIDPRYVDVIRKRWTKFAKENGLKIGSGGLE
jgi:site-specific DNA-methyltransferase (adenine-specific)